MQQCFNCGQLNDDSEEYCIYCGESLYVQVNQNSTSNKRMDHLYADSIAQELIDSNTDFEDDFDDIKRELLGQTPNQEISIEEDEDFIFPIEQEEEVEENVKDEELIKIEEEIKKKIRRNKKLEMSMGLVIRNIEVILDDINGPLEIMGEITTNDKLDNKSVQLSAISYDINKHPLDKMKTIISVDHGNFESFSISINIDFQKTAIVILLPEMIQYDSEEDNIEIIQEENVETREEYEEEPEEPVQEPEEYEYPEYLKETRNTTKENSIFIEQMRDIEHKIGLSISNTSILIKNDESIEIVGEIRISNPDQYSRINIVATCYDNNNNIIGTNSKQINTKLFLGFDTLSIKLNEINVNNIQRVLLYPTFQ